MPDVSFTNLLLIMAVVVAAPLLLDYLPRAHIPSVVVGSTASATASWCRSCSSPAGFSSGLFSRPTVLLQVPALLLALLVVRGIPAVLPKHAEPHTTGSPPACCWRRRCPSS